RTRPGREQVEELGVEVTTLFAQHPTQLGRQGEPAGGGEGLADLGCAELTGGPLVDPWRIGPQRQAQHHVGQVDGLAPRARADLGEGDVDQQDVTVTYEQVGRLDVAVGQPCVPQLADHRQTVVDDRVVDVGFAELNGAVEELGDQQVFALRGELHEAV